MQRNNCWQGEQTECGGFQRVGDGLSAVNIPENNLAKHGKHYESSNLKIFLKKTLLRQKLEENLFTSSKL